METALCTGCINSLPALTWMVKEMELPFHFSAFLWDISPKSRSYHWRHQGHVFSIDRGFSFRTANYTNKCMIKGCPACKRLNHHFFFLLFPPVTQHDPISVRVQAIPAHVVQTGEWLLMISDEFLFKTVKRETEKIFIVVWNDHRWWTHRSEDL